MSFATDINAIMTADTSLNGLVDGGIHYENLIDNWLANTSYNEWVVYAFNKTEQVNCVDSKNVYMNYLMNVTVIQRDTNTNIDTITDRLINYLNNLADGNIIDIAFKSDNHGFGQQQGIYTNTLDFDVTYIEN